MLGDDPSSDVDSHPGALITPAATVGGRLHLHDGVDAARRGRARAAGLAGSASVRWQLLKVRLVPPAALADRLPADDGDPDDWRFLARPAVLGLVALVAIALGASLTSSPFKLEMPGTWFFGVPAVTNNGDQTTLLLGLVGVYGGLVLLARVWYGLWKTLRRRPGVPVRHLSMMLALWAVPMLVVAPLFSRDVFSYAAQGEMMSRHINPYNYGPYTLGSGPFPAPVDPLWQNTPAPYGPLFLMIDGFLANLSLHHELVTVVFLRLLALAGVALVAWCIPKLARAYGRDAGPVYVLAVLNPLVLLTLVGGAHNDAIMIGLVVAGITAAKLRRPVLGVVLCSLAAAIKVPAALGILYVGWEWLGPGLPVRQRVRPVVTATLLAATVMAFFSLVSGLGWGWIANLETPGAVRSWLAPATGVGLALSGLAHTLGIGVSLGGVLSFTRVLGLTAAAGLALYLLLRSDRLGAMRSLGLSMLLFVLLGPVVQPWYLTWGIVLLAPVATGRLRSLLIAFSVAVPFIGLTGGRTLISELLRANPMAVVAALVVLVAVLVTPLGRWTTSWWRDPAGAELAIRPDDPWPQVALEG
jgi:hypothetical protein